MPIDVVVMEFCADYWSQFEVPTSRGTDEWIVTWDGPSVAAHCTCPAYKFSGARASCKHIDRTFLEGCFYNPQVGIGGAANLRPVRVPTNVVPGGECPKCKGPTVAVQVGV